MRDVLVIAVLAGGCYEATYIVGLACPEGDCPPGQSCVDGRCLYGDGTSSPFGHCLLHTDDGCDLGEKCTITELASSSTTVCSLAGELVLGQRCVGYGINDLCQAGLVCAGKTCRRLCDPSSSRDSCGGNRCVPFGAFGLCLESCDPLARDCPDVDGLAQACYLDGDGGWCLTSDENRVPGVVCTVSTECASGNGCVDGVCRPYCDYSAAPDQQGSCPTNQLCRLHVPNPNNVGVCS
jgi:hypothetical protein